MKKIGFGLYCFVISSVFTLASAQEAPKKDLTFEFAGFPGVNYTSDGGVGFGVIGSMYGRKPEVKPYQFSVDLQIFASTAGQQSHYLRADWLKALSLPLRLRAKLGYVATTNENYCGQGTAANCATSSLLSDDYFLVRYSEKFGRFEGRWTLKDRPHQMELMTAFRGSIYEPGSMSTSIPYPGSLYSSDFVNGERGFASVFEIGVMFDNRDQEASPTSGYWIETSLRESSPTWGSTWQYFGANVSAHTYVSFDEPKHLVLAAQFIADAIVGDAPLAEIVRVGNSQGFTAFGGSELGRGVRSQYFPGRLKLLEQLELRYHFLDFKLFSQQFGLAGLVFGDLGMIAWRIEQLETEPKKALAGFGGGVRLNWNTDFVIRLDLGLSSVENYSPKVYLKVGNVF